MTQKPRVTQVNTNRITRKQSLHASVIRACKCGAPGFWHNVDPDKDPTAVRACYAPEKVTNLGENPVGKICPNCGSPREEIERLGEIWSKVWRTSFWEFLKDAFVPVKWRKQ